MHIVEQMGLGEKDVITWKLDKDRDEWIATIRNKASNTTAREKN